MLWVKSFFLMILCGVAFGVEEPLDIFMRAHNLRVDYEVRGGLLVESKLMEAFPPEARAMYGDLPSARMERGPDGREFFLNSTVTWFGSTDGGLRIERRTIYVGGSPERGTSVTIWTPTEHLEGPMSASTPATADLFEPLTLDQEMEFWAQRRTPFVRMRAEEGGYIELVRYALRVLAGAEDTEWGGDAAENKIWGRSDSWQVYVEGDATLGEVDVVVLGISSKIASRYEYEGRLPVSLFPARYPAHEFAYHYDIAPGADEWWEPSERPPVRSYISYYSAELSENRPELFAWHDPDWDRNSVHDPVIMKIDSDGVPKTEPIFVPSKTSPGKMVPNSPASNTSVVLLAAGTALVLAGGILVIRRKTG